jgi:hypothetical protein
VQLVFQGSTVKDATDFFSIYLDRPVIDRTGIEGEYDFTLEFKGNRRGPWIRGGLPPMAGFDAARLTMAFEGIGFKVESTTAPFEILIIDHVQRPSLLADVVRPPDGGRSRTLIVARAFVSFDSSRSSWLRAVNVSDNRVMI